MAPDNPIQQKSQTTQEFVIPPAGKFESLSKEDLQSPGDVLVLKHKLIIREGEHNGVFYSWEELKQVVETGEGSSLYYDHDDSASNWVGDVKNLKADDASKSIFGDLHIVDPVAAKKLRYGAKWGVSPTIDAERVVKDGRTLALDPKIISNSLVIRPAVRETMLNSENTVEKEVKSMEENNKREIEELAQKHEKEVNAINDKHTEELESEKKKGNDLNEKVEKYEAEKLEQESSKVLELGSKYGILNEEDLSEIKELSDKGRDFVSKVIGRVAKTLKLDEGKDEDESEDKENEEKSKDEAKSGEKEELGESQKRIKEELSAKESSQEKVSKNMFEYMREQQSK